MKSVVYVGDTPVSNSCLKVMLKSWTPKPTVASTIWSYGGFAVAMFIISIILFVYNGKLGYHLI